MKLLFTFAIIVFTVELVFPQEIDTRVINIGYWEEMASRGLIQGQELIEPPPASFTGSMLYRENAREVNSLDIAITEGDTVTQSENSVFINPLDPNKVIHSNNSTNWNGSAVTLLYGADAFNSDDGGTEWQGQVEGAGGTNKGDPATAIDNDGRYYIGFISSDKGQSIAYSDDEGVSWVPSQIIQGPLGYYDIFDKNHLWIDNSSASPYEGRLYSAWTIFQGGSGDDKEVVLSYSIDGGDSWTTPQNISSNVNAGSHNQGVNIQTGPNGEIYAVWAIYDSWPWTVGSDETAIGFAKSTDGGQTFNSATRIIENIRGIRSSGTSKNMRVNSFPVMAVDISPGPNQGNIYVVWSNIGVPGTNTGNDIDIYMIKSMDGGSNWTSPVKVNQDPSNQGKEHYFPWITCDPVTGDLHVIFYDDRNVGSTECEVFVASSYDGGDTWEDFKVSDVSFTPTPIPDLADGYFGDYLGISARNGKVYPVWTDNRSGVALAYTSPFDTKSITLSNRHNGDPVSNLGGTLSLDNLYNDDLDFTYVESDSDPVPVTINDQYSVRTNNHTLQGERHLLWNSNNEDYFLEKANFEMIEEIIDLGLNANFDVQDAVTISSNHPVELQLHDPWYIENPDDPNPGDWIQPNTFHALESPTYPVFLNQGGTNPNNLQPPYYSLRVPLMVEDDGEWKIFSQWSGSGVTFPGGQSTCANQETPVVFTQAGAEVVAEYVPPSHPSLIGQTRTLYPEETLILPAGTDLQLPEGFSLNIQGELLIQGTRVQPVNVTGTGKLTDVDPGDWDWNHGGALLLPGNRHPLFTFSGGAFRGELNHLVISDTPVAIGLANTPTPSSTGGILELDNVEIRNSNIGMLLQEPNNNEVQIRDASFTGNDLAISLGAGLSEANQTSQYNFTRCVFTGSSTTAFWTTLYNSFWPEVYTSALNISLTNCTFHQNGGAAPCIPGGINYGSYPDGQYKGILTFELRNNIFSASDLWMSSDPQVEDYNLFHESSFEYHTYGDSTIFADPLFVNASGGDFHLQAASLAINRGEPDFNGNGQTWETDMDDQDPDGTRMDMGAFYYPQLTGTVTQDITLSGAATLGNAIGEDVIIPAGYSLTVDPGTAVFVRPNTRLVVNGSLSIQGTPDSPVTFITEAGATWTGITVSGGVAEVDYCEIQSAAGSALGVSNHTSGWIRNSNLHDNNQGLSLTNVDDTFEVRDNAIHHNETGISTRTSQADLIGNHVYENSQTGMLLLAGTNGLIANNEIDNNGNGVDFNSSGMYLISSSPVLSQTLLKSVLPQENNIIHDNSGFGIYSSFTGLPNLGTFQESALKITGGFNHFYNNSNTALYRNDNFRATPDGPIELPADYPSLMADVNYWDQDLYNTVEPGTAEIHGSVHWYPVAASFNNGNTNNDYEHVALLGDGLIAEQDAEFEAAIDYYQQFLASDPPDKDQMIAAMSGMDRCYGHLKAVDQWQVQLEAIAANFDKEEQQKLAQNYLIWVYKKLGLDAEAIAAAQSLIDDCSDPEYVDYYTLEIALLLDETDGAILAKTSPAQRQLADRINQARHHLLAMDRQTEAANVYKLIKGISVVPANVSGVPNSYALQPAYPNPFNPVTNIGFDLPTASQIQLVIYDIQGREVTRLINDTRAAGKYSVQWQGKDDSGRMVASGLYFYTLEALATGSDKTFRASRKMLLMK